MVKMKWFQEHPDKEKLSKPIEINYSSHLVQQVYANNTYTQFGCEIELNNEKVLAINLNRKKCSISRSVFCSYNTITLMFCTYTWQLHISRSYAGHIYIEYGQYSL